MASLNKKYRTLKDISLDVRENILRDYTSGVNSKGKRYSLTDLEIKYHISKSSINKILHQMQDSGNYEFKWRGYPIQQKPSKLEEYTISPTSEQKIQPNYITIKPSKNSSYSIKPRKSKVLKVAAAIALSLIPSISTSTSDSQVNTNYAPQASVYHEEEIIISVTQPQLTTSKVEAILEQEVEYSPVKVKEKKTAFFASLNFGVQKTFSTLENKLSELRDYSRKHYEEVAGNLPNGLKGKYDEAHKAIVLEGGLAVNPNADLRTMYNLANHQIAKINLSEKEIKIQYDMDDLATKLFFFRDETIRDNNLTIAQLAELDNKISASDFKPIKLSYELAVARMEERGLSLF